MMMVRSRRRRPTRQFLEPAKTPVSEENQDTYWSGSLIIAEIIIESPQVRTLRLISPEGGSIPFHFLPGQYIDVEAAIDGETYHRSYSISSSARRIDCLDITVKREPYGLVSPWLCDAIKLGDRLNIRGPFGQFTFTGTEAQSVVLVGAGVGITPFVSMIRTLLDDAWQGDVHALFGFRNWKEALFLEEMESLAATFPTLNLHLTWSKPESRKLRPKGRITPRLIRKTIPRWRDRLYYLCGPLDMMDHVRSDLVWRGVPVDRVLTEAFAPPPRDESLGGEFKITFQRFGVEITSEQGESLLETATRAGVMMDFSCLSGTCGLCQARLVEGDVEMMADDALRQEDIERGEILTCQAFPKSPCVIDA